MPYAANGQISRSPIPGGIEISGHQYMLALEGMQTGKVVNINQGFALIDPPTPEQPAPAPLPDTMGGALALKFAELDAKRRAVEEGGILFNGVRLKTDRQTAAIITAAYMKADKDPAYVIPNWKFSDGVFAPLDAATIIAAGDAISEHVQSAFDREAALTAELLAKTEVADVLAFDVDARW